jgi:ATP-dependent exoDNAse (exonuclease V) beta subunit
LAAKAGCGQIFGLSWPATIEPAGGGRVQVLQVDDDALEASTIAERLSEMRGLDADLAWTDCAVLARRHAALEPVRAVLEERGVPVSWTPERGSLPPLGRVREIAAFLRALEAVEKEARSASQLEARRQELAGDDAGNPWWRLVAEIVAEWRDELADATARWTRRSSTSGRGVVAALSREAARGWAERLMEVESMRVLALVERRAEDSEEAFRSRYRCERWEVPLVEVVERPRELPDEGR